MKTRLFLLVSFLLAAVTMSAQTLEVLAVENSEVATNATADVIYVEAGCVLDDDPYGGNGQRLTAMVTISEPISCEVMVKFQVRGVSGSSPWVEDFSIWLSPGETYKAKHGDSYSYGAYVTEIRGEDFWPWGCDGKTIIYNL